MSITPETAPKSQIPNALKRPPQAAVGIIVLCGALFFTTILTDTGTVLAPLWLLGMAAGFVLQRSRFCFASAFRDLFLFGQSRMLTGILAGLAVATAGFALMMWREVPFPEFGATPAEAHILPAGLSTIIAGVVFGVGMVIAGGCSSGSLYRVGEGYAASAVAVLGMVGGLILLSYQWNWWWDTLIQHETSVWLPDKLGGYGMAVAVTLVGIAVVFLVGLWWEVRNGFAMPSMKKQQADDGMEIPTMSGRLKGIARPVFVDGWSPVIGGIALGVISLLMYITLQPFGVTGELNRWGLKLTEALDVSPGTLKGLDAIGGCAARAAEGGTYTTTFAVTVGVIAGSLVAALFAGEFKLRFPRKKIRYGQAAVGGVMMGYSSGLAIGCTVGAFFSAIPSLALSGWLFGASLAAGAWIGVQVIRRIP